MCFSAAFWNERYQNNQTGWDLNGPSTPLKEYIDQIEDKNIRILIPGCGNAYEAEYLIQQGFTSITLVDISDVLVNNLKEKFIDNPSINIINQDFFDLDGNFDLILEQTFFCALSPSLRTNYVNKIHDLLAPNGLLVGVLFQVDFGQPYPPFGGSKVEYKNLFSEKFKIEKLETCYNSIKPRKGSELFIQFRKTNK